ncbi:MAG TPA: hypothetical protein ENJ89_01625, partial [Caldithrix abyssi]|nr:hypothetical protein [Caldithrix abyssi]
MLHDLILNHDMLPKRTFNTRSPSGQTKQRAVENVEYIIIVPDDPDFIAWGDSLRVFRNQQGISTGVVTTTEIGGNTFEAIESYVNDAYYNWETPPAAVLLLADYGNSGSTITSSPEEPHPYSGTYISDNYFADVDEDDLPDIVFSRITAQNETDLENTVKKILDYERHPPTNPDYYNHPVTAMGWQTERWFQLCSEIINGFWEHVLGKQPVRENAIYSGTPGDVWSTAENTETIVDYFGPNGLGYIPETPEHLTDWGGNATRINNDINSGAFMVQHRDHGSETGWGEPDYDINDLNDLDNNDLTFVFSVNCLTGKFNMDGECFVEAFHRRAKRALGLIGATQVSYSFVNDTYNWGMYDNLWPEFMPDETTTFPTRFILPSYGNAAGKYFLQASDWPYNTEDKEITYYLFHHHGGAYSMVYSEMPQNLTVSHDSQLQAGETTFTVTADEGSLIGLSVNGELIGSADGTGEPVAIEIEPQDPGAVMLVTVTKQNYYRYSSEVEVVNADGPHITVDSYTVDDSESGNNNQEADFNESFYLNVNAKNIGSETAFGVHAVLTTTDAYLTVSDSTHFYGDIATDQVVAGDTAFYLQAADDVPDQHSASCNVRFSDSQGGEWNSTLSLIINAPALAVEDLQIDDSAGGNNDGDLDEGETASFIIPAVNNGHADAPNTEATLTTESPYLTIENSSYTVGTLAAGDTANTVFTVTADPETPASTEAQLTYTVTSGAYTAQRIFTILIGERPVYLMSNETITLDDDAFFYDSGGKDNDYGTSE